jgi:DNA modification methylase
MYQEAVMVQPGENTVKRAKHLSERDKVRYESGTSSGFGRNMQNCVGRDLIYPDNVLHLATSTTNTGHSAAFPPSLPNWFIRLFTIAGDTVLDPFMGSGTTVREAVKLGREAIGIDVVPEYCRLVDDWLTGYRAEPEKVE